MSWRIWVAWACIACSVGAGAPDASAPGRFPLRSDGRWLLSPPPGRFDASALMRLPDGSWRVANDKQAPLFRMVLSTNETGRLEPVPELFPLAGLREAAGNPRFVPDMEGLARDDQGRIYLCTEKERWIFRTSANGGKVERLDIDWSPVRRWLSGTDLNASWEGLAIGGGRLYVANERGTGRIVGVDLGSLRVVDDFQALPIGSKEWDVHYSDLCWQGGALWVLCRAHQLVLRVDPVTHRTLAQFDYGPIERARENAYTVPLGIGMAEGLWVDATHLWVLIDNNGFGRKEDAKDQRPLLFRCRRPDVGGEP
ncbi:MAG: esterase-like activity of phytase family protein, partial [Verrucomicrobiota bacterium]